MNIKFKYRVDQLLSYFRRRRVGGDQNLHPNSSTDENHTTMEETAPDVQIYKYQPLWDTKCQKILEEAMRKPVEIQRTAHPYTQHTCAEPLETLSEADHIV
jgi:hypothetical protein